MVNIYSRSYHQDNFFIFLEKHADYAEPITQCYYELHHAGFIFSLLNANTRKLVKDNYLYSSQIASALGYLNKHYLLTEKNFLLISQCPQHAPNVAKALVLLSHAGKLNDVTRKLVANSFSLEVAQVIIP